MKNAPRSGKDLYQLEVKRLLVEQEFNPDLGWRVTVDVDAMELGKGSQQTRAKARRARTALAALRAMGVEIGKHHMYGRADVVADHPKLGRRIIEVEGVSTRQPEQAVYSALGQLLLVHRPSGPRLRYGLAVPDSQRWRRQLRKIPLRVRRMLALDLYVVRWDSITVVRPDQQVLE